MSGTLSSLWLICSLTAIGAGISYRNQQKEAGEVLIDAFAFYFFVLALGPVCIGFILQDIVGDLKKIRKKITESKPL